jgi:hypothetical protein
VESVPVLRQGWGFRSHRVRQPVCAADTRRLWDSPLDGQHSLGETVASARIAGSAAAAGPIAGAGPTAAAGPIATADPTAGGAEPRRLQRLDAVVDEVVGAALDELDEPSIRTELGAIERASRRLAARQCRLAAALAARQRARAQQANPHDHRAGDRATRQVQRELADELQWSQAEANRATAVGEQAGRSTQLGEALDEGKLSPRHATILAETLRPLFGEDRERAESVLVAAAAKEDAKTFGRTCRRLLAELDHAAAMQAEARRHSRRRGSLYQTEDGMVGLSAQFSGLDGETVWTAVHAFRRPDVKDECRTPKQATADAIVAMAEAALRAGEARADHGIRPHVIVTVPQTAVATGSGVAETMWSGPLPTGAVERAFDDCGVSRLVQDARGVPVEASEEVRTVPIGVYRGLLERDRHCIRVGCDQPAVWCQVMHLGTPYRFQGRLSLRTAGLGCVVHHRGYDAGRLELSWRQGRPILHRHGERPPDATAAIDDPPPEPPGEPPGSGPPERPPDRPPERPPAA